MKSASLLRSILFGIGAKLVGAAVVFFGLPIIGKKLALSDYAEFLNIMAFASGLLMAVGATSTLTARALANARLSGDQALLAYSQRETSANFLACAILTMAFGTVTLLLTDQTRLSVRSGFFWICCLVTIQCIFQWGEAYRLGSRSDHVSSSFLMLSSACVFLALLFTPTLTLSRTLAIYFGLPMVAQAFIFAQVVYKDDLRPTPHFSARGLFQWLRELAPLVLMSSGDYLRIFGFGLLLAVVATDAEQVKYATLVLLVARLVNPISLITRPLMPALLEARMTRDIAWETRLQRRVLLYPFVAAVPVIAGTQLVPQSTWHLLLPINVSVVSSFDALWISIFLLSHATCVLWSPFFLTEQVSAMHFAIRTVSTSLLSLGAGAALSVRYGGGAMFVAVAVGTTMCAAWHAHALMVRTR